MKQLYTFLCILFFAASGQAQMVFYQLNQKNLLETFYGGQDWDGMALIWSPSYEDKIRLSLENEHEQVRTRVDTIFRYEENGRPQAVVVFATATTRDCHACGQFLGVAKFDYSPVDRYWTVTSFRKLMQNHGAWGAFGEVRLEKIGAEFPLFALNLIGGYTQNGATVERQNFLSLSDYTGNFPKIFSVETYYDNAGAAMTDSEKIERKTKLTYQDNKDILLTTIENGKVISKTTYQYQQDENLPNIGTYQKVCK